MRILISIVPHFNKLKRKSLESLYILITVDLFSSLLFLILFILFGWDHLHENFRILPHKLNDFIPLLLVIPLLFLFQLVRRVFLSIMTLVTLHIRLRILGPKVVILLNPDLGLFLRLSRALNRLRLVQFVIESLQTLGTLAVVLLSVDLPVASLELFLNEFNDLVHLDLAVVPDRVPRYFFYLAHQGKDPPRVDEPLLQAQPLAEQEVGLDLAQDVGLQFLGSQLLFVHYGQVWVLTTEIVGHLQGPDSFLLGGLAGSGRHRNGILF